MTPRQGGQIALVIARHYAPKCSRRELLMWAGLPSNNEQTRETELIERAITGMAQVTLRTGNVDGGLREELADGPIDPDLAEKIIAIIGLNEFEETEKMVVLGQVEQPLLQGLFDHA